MARPLPTSRGSRCVPVPPGRMPSGTSIWLTTVRPIAPNRMSHDDASSLPPPPTRPLISAIVALGIVRNRSHIWWNGFGVDSRSRLALRRELQDRLDVEVRDEEVGVRAAQNEHLHIGVGFDFRGQPHQLEVERDRHDVDRRRVDRRDGHAAVDLEVDEIAHQSPARSRLPCLLASAAWRIRLRAIDDSCLEERLS